MNAIAPPVLVAGLLLIGVGLVYPMVALVRMNQQLGKGAPSRQVIAVTLAFHALLPLTAVLAGFYVLSTRAQHSPFFAGALLGSAVLLVITAVARWWLGRGK